MWGLSAGREASPDASAMFVPGRGGAIWGSLPTGQALIRKGDCDEHDGSMVSRDGEQPVAGTGRLRRRGAGRALRLHDAGDGRKLAVLGVGDAESAREHDLVAVRPGLQLPLGGHGERHGAHRARVRGRRLCDRGRRLGYAEPPHGQRRCEKRAALAEHDLLPLDLPVGDGLQPLAHHQRRRDAFGQLRRARRAHGVGRLLRQRRRRHALRRDEPRKLHGDGRLRGADGDAADPGDGHVSHMDAEHGDLRAARNDCGQRLGDDLGRDLLRYDKHRDAERIDHAALSPRGRGADPERRLVQPRAVQ